MKNGRGRKEGRKHGENISSKISLYGLLFHSSKIPPGVGRAGLFACCWLLKNLYCLSPERAIRFVRIRRSPKAIETMQQAEFIVQYAEYVGRALERQSMAEVRARMMLQRERERERERIALMQIVAQRRESREEQIRMPGMPLLTPVPGSFESDSYVATKSAMLLKRNSL